MREKELRLSQQLVELQKHYNDMCRMKDEWMDSYHQMKKDRDKCWKRALELEAYISSNLREEESFPDI